MNDYPLAVIGIDPGGTTGAAVMVFKSADAEPELVQRFQWTQWEWVTRELRVLIKHWKNDGYRVVLAAEQFDKRPGIVNPDFTPKFVNKMIVSEITDTEIKWQLPAQAMTLVPPARRSGRSDALKRFGWYGVSSVHSNDAVRHCVVYAVETLAHMPTILKGWPKK